MMAVLTRLRASDAGHESIVNLVGEMMDTTKSKQRQEIPAPLFDVLHPPKPQRFSKCCAVEKKECGFGTKTCCNISHFKLHRVKDMASAKPVVQEEQRRIDAKYAKKVKNMVDDAEESDSDSSTSTSTSTTTMDKEEEDDLVMVALPRSCLAEKLDPDDYTKVPSRWVFNVIDKCMTPSSERDMKEFLETLFVNNSKSKGKADYVKRWRESKTKTKTNTKTTKKRKRKDDSGKKKKKKTKNNNNNGDDDVPPSVL